MIDAAESSGLHNTCQALPAATSPEPENRLAATIPASSATDTARNTACLAAARRSARENPGSPPAGAPTYVSFDCFVCVVTNYPPRRSVA